MRSILGLFRLVAALTLTVVLSGACGADPQQAEGEIGTVSMQLTTNVGTTTYRLSTAVFTIGGGPTTTQLFSSDDPAETALTAELAVGDYTSTLEPGWVLERNEGGTFVAVPATLVSSNPVSFVITDGGVTNLAYQFNTPGATVTVGTGTLVISVGVTETGTCLAGCDASCVLTSTTSNCSEGFAATPLCTLGKTCVGSCECVPSP
jgi:hypothetical protein